MVRRWLKISKFLSYHLRHRPDLLRIELAPGGWVNVDELLQAAKENNFQIDALQMNQANYRFYRSDNGVWLTEFVPVKYLQAIALIANFVN